ncbi:MAG: ParB/RepB/Spo0J family partition protein, partial [Pseudomonadales bacterium]|nr:ParB/RepB/Spo0J family partition protein [Pseudomonadales bacterium]
MAARKRGLGRGLDALLGEAGEKKSEARGQVLQEVPVDWIRPGKYQPRKGMDEEALSELAASIKAQGVMQPIVLRAVADNQYEIVAGERRWRATQLA